MQAYGREMYRPHENLDEYEDEDDYEEEDGEEYYEEEEDPKPSEAVLEYLEVRQKFKESIRKKLKKENGSLDSLHQDKKKRLPYDNFGSFFGPSQPAIAQRVIQERKSLQETQHLVSRTLHTQNGSEKSLSGARPGVSKPQPRPIDLVKLKAQKEKDHKDYSRDYAFLFSDDAELPAPTKEPPRNVSVPKSDARSTQGPSRSKLSVSDHGKTISGFSQRKLHSANRPIPKASSNKIASQSRPSTTSVDPRKKVASGSTNASRQPMDSKRLVPKMGAPCKLPTSSKISAPIMDKKGSSMGVKRPISNPPKAPLPASHSSAQRRFPEQSLQKQFPEQKRPLQQSDRAKPISKPPLSAPKPQIKPPKQIPPRERLQADRPKKRPDRPFVDDDEDDPRAMIRKMFGYDPRKYAGVEEDDSDMEANFDDIMEEERRSEMIGKREDEIQLKLIEEEERREEAARRRRLEAKRRKR